MTVHDIISPIDGSVFASPEVTPDRAAHRIVERARASQRDWAAMPLSRRLLYCRAFVAAIEADTARIAHELTWQMGRPIAYTPEEVARLVERVDTMIAAAERGLAPIELGAGEVARRIERVPHGVCLVIAPWNYPYLTAINTIIPALIAGNTVILKPAAQTALTGDRLAAAFAAAGFPEGVFQSALVTHETVGRWIGMRAVDFVSFTGSVNGGAAIEQASVGRFLPVSLELGGKDPAYVRADADLDFVVRELVDGAFFNSGQSCCGVERIYVDAKLYDDFVERFVTVTGQTQVLGDPTQVATTLGPVVSTRAAQMICDQISDAVARGATLHTGSAEANNGAYLPATVLTGVNHSMPVMVEETFGPSVGIMRVADDTAALRLMNDSRYGLSASIWTKDMIAAERLSGEISTGTVFVNRCDYLDPALAWVGVRDSGRGCSLSEIGFHHVTRPKSFYGRP